MPPDKYHEVFINIAAGIIVFVVLTSLVIFILLFYQKKRFLHNKKLLEMEKQYREELLQVQLETQEQTLQYLSDELHDNLGQVASLIKLNLHTLQLSDDSKDKEKLDATIQLTRSLIADMKSLSVSLGSDHIARTGLYRAIEMEVERVNKTGQFVAVFKRENEVPDISNDKAIIIYRMVQEVLNNIVKHSSAKQLTVRVRTTENLVILAISDDGKGFDVENKMKNGNGAGLYNLKKRAALIGADFTILSTPGNGTKITIGLPL